MHQIDPNLNVSDDIIGFIKLRLTLKARFLRYTQAKLRTLKIKTHIKTPVKSLSELQLNCEDPYITLMFRF